MGNIIIYRTVFILFFPLISIFSFTPYIARSGSVFGITIPKDAINNKVIIRLKRFYSIFAVLFGVIFAVVSLYIKSPYYAAVAYILICLVMFIINNKLLTNIITQEDYKNYQKPLYIKNINREYKPKVVSYFITLVLLIPSFILGYISFRFKTPYSFLITISSFVIFLICIIVFVMIKNTSQYIKGEDFSDEIETNNKKRYIFCWLIFVICLVIDLFLIALQMYLCNILKGGENLISIAFYTLTVVVTISFIAFCKIANNIK